MENDKHAEEYVSHLKSAKEIFAARDEAAKRVKEETLEDSETAIMDVKGGFCGWSFINLSFFVPVVCFLVVTMEELNSLGFASPMGCFESTSYTMRYRLFAVKEEKLGLRYQSSASIRHPCFLLFPLLEKGLSKKGKDRSDVSDFILK